MVKPQVTITKKDGFKILINNLPHLHLNPQPSGFQSYIDDSREVRYVIEYYWNGGIVETEYESRELWEIILKQL